MTGERSLREEIFDQLDGLAETTGELVHEPTEAGRAAQSTIAHDLNEIRYAVGHDEPPAAPSPATKEIEDAG